MDSQPSTWKTWLQRQGPLDLTGLVGKPLSITSASTPTTSFNSIAPCSPDRDIAPGSILTVMVSPEGSQLTPGDHDSWVSSAVITLLEDFMGSLEPGNQRDFLATQLRHLRRNYEWIRQNELTGFGQDISWHKGDPPSP